MDETKQKVFVDGMRFFKPRDGSPAFVKGRISIEPTKLIAFLKANKEHMVNGYFGIDMKVSRESGNLYFELDQWKPKPKAEEDIFGGVLEASPEEIDPSSIPF